MRKTTKGILYRFVFAKGTGYCDGLRSR